MVLDLPGFSSKRERRLPSRVLGVGLDSLSNVCLRQPADLDTAPHVALSYCWGRPAKPFITATENLNERLSSISLEAMPPTLRDAIILTRCLSLRYIWIDALCIFQDDHTD